MSTLKINANRLNDILQRSCQWGAYIPLLSCANVTAQVTGE